MPRKITSAKKTPKPARGIRPHRLRHEIKYLIDEGTYRVLQGRLLPLTRPDPYGEDGEYRVTSVYFDDIFASAYREKLNGTEFRRKFRIRSYGLDSEFISLEAKHKQRDLVYKQTARLTAEQYLSLLSGDSGFMKTYDGSEDAFGEYYRADKMSRLRPRVIVDYTRKAFVYPFGNVRITFDKTLSTCYNTIDMFSQSAAYSKVYDKEIILEIKFDNYIPISIQSVLQGLNTAAQSISKYTICCDALSNYGFKPYLFTIGSGGTQREVSDNDDLVSTIERGVANR